MTPTNSLLSYLWTKYEKHVKDLTQGARQAHNLPASHYHEWAAQHLASNPIVENFFTADGYLVRLQSGDLLLLSASLQSSNGKRVQPTRRVASIHEPPPSHESIESKAIQI